MTERWNAEPAGPRVWDDNTDLLGQPGERSSSYPPDALITLRFIWDAIRRYALTWIATGIVGLVIGLAFPLLLPPDHVASTKLLMTHQEGTDPAREMATDASLAKTRTVAERAVRQLDLTATADDLLQQYTATPLTDRVLEITVSAPSAARATRLATALSETFLAFRMEQVRAQQEPVQQQLRAVRARIETLNGDPVADARARLDRAKEHVERLRQALEDEQVSASLLGSSRTLDPAAPVKRSVRKTIAIDAMSGVAAGASVGLGFVVLRAILSDRLRSRRDIAQALDTRVTLSIGRVGRRWRSPRALIANAPLQTAERDLAVRHLRQLVFRRELPKPALAIVSVDNAPVCSRIVAPLALALAAEGRRVLVADLAGGTLARTLGVRQPGTAASPLEQANGMVTVHLPESSAVAVAGPLLPSSGDSLAERESLVAAYAAADIVLTLADPSPALGADHLRGWSTRAVAVLTAGRSTAIRIHSTGAMIRLAALRLESAILLRADRTDETDGLPAGAELRPETVGS